MVRPKPLQARTPRWSPSSRRKTSIAMVRTAALWFEQMPVTNFAGDLAEHHADIRATLGTYPLAPLHLPSQARFTCLADLLVAYFWSTLTILMPLSFLNQTKTTLTYINAS